MVVSLESNMCGALIGAGTPVVLMSLVVNFICLTCTGRSFQFAAGEE